MYTCRHTDAGKEDSEKNKKDPHRQPYAAPQCSDQKDGEYVSAGKGLSLTIPGDQRQDIVHLIRTRTVDQLSDSAHGQKKEGGQKQKGKEAFIETDSAHDQKDGI